MESMLEILEALVKEILDVKPYSNHVVKIIYNTPTDTYRHIRICMSDGRMLVASVYVKNGKVAVFCNGMKPARTLKVDAYLVGDPSFAEKILKPAVLRK